MGSSGSKKSIKMTTLTKFIISTIMGLLMLSCNFDMGLIGGVNGNGNVVTEERDIKDNFNSIEAHAGLDVYLTQNGQNSVIVEADENLQDMVLTYVEGDVLHLTVDGNINFAESRTVRVSFGDIKEIHSHSGSDVYSEGVIKGRDLEFSSSSGSDMTLEIEAENVTLSSSSGADLKVSGVTNSLKASASSGSDIKAENLVSQKCTASASSGADISLYTKQELIAKANSGGDIRYSGNPSKVKKNDSPSGSIRGN